MSHMSLQNSLRKTEFYAVDLPFPPEFGRFPSKTDFALWTRHSYSSCGKIF